MKKSTGFLCFSLIITCSSNLYAETESICSLMEPENEACFIKTASHSYSISANGILIQQNINQRIQFNLPENFHIETIQYKPIKNKIVFTFSISDGDSGSVLVSLYNEVSQQFEWQTELFAFNTSPILIHDNAIYLGGIGVIAKLDLNEGKIIWHHLGLYERDTQAYNAFETPIKRGQYIVFKELKVPGAAYEGIREIHVLDSTGKIIKK